VAFVALVLGSTRAAADAPTNPPQYDSFTQDDRTIKDLRTLLEWERAVLRNDTETNARVYCANTAFGGTGGGRVPTIKELLTLFDEEPHPEYDIVPAPPRNIDKHIDQPAFDGTPVDLPYWTSTPAERTTRLWTLSFMDGAMTGAEPSSRAHVRCVR